MSKFENVLIEKNECFVVREVSLRGTVFFIARFKVAAVVLEGSVVEETTGSCRRSFFCDDSPFTKNLFYFGTADYFELEDDGF